MQRERTERFNEMGYSKDADWPRQLGDGQGKVGEAVGLPEWQANKQTKRATNKRQGNHQRRRLKPAVSNVHRSPFTVHL